MDNSQLTQHVWHYLAVMLNPMLITTVLNATDDHTDYCHLVNTLLGDWNRPLSWDMGDHIPTLGRLGTLENFACTGAGQKQPAVVR